MRRPNLILLALMVSWALAVVPCGWASTEALGVAYVPVQDPQTGEPVVMAVPFMNSEPGAVERALEFIGKPLHLTAVGPVLTNRTDDVNLVSMNGIKLKAAYVGNSPSLVVTVLLPDKTPTLGPDIASVMQALRECVRRTAQHYGVSDCRVSELEEARAARSSREAAALDQLGTQQP